MENQDMFAFKLQLLRDEIAEIQSKISTYDDLSFKIKGWSITLWIGILGFSINQESPVFPLAAIPILFAFWILDMYFKSYQQRSMVRMGYIEDFINRRGNHEGKGLEEAFRERSFGSFTTYDPIGRQTRKIDTAFKERFERKTNYKRCFWIRNVRVLYLFLIGFSLIASIVMLTINLIG